MQICEVISYKPRLFKITYNILPFLCVETHLQYSLDCILSLKDQKLELASTNFQLADIFFDVTLLFYNPDLSQKHYFVFSNSSPPRHRT